MASRKIVIIGAGSLFFGRQAIWALTNREGFRGFTLSLVDTDPHRLEQMAKLARLAADGSGSGIDIEAHADYRDALPGADFVVLSFSRDNAHYRGIDCRISAKYGIRMCSGDTIGPGGVFRAARELPVILDICRAVERICPEAWVVNYVNPSSVMGIGVMRHSNVRSFALCDSHPMPAKKESYLNLIGEPVERIDEFDMRIAGVNHFTWMLKAELGGENVLHRIRDAFAALAAGEKDAGHSKARFNNYITAQLADVFGAIPTCTGHTKEYLPYYQGRAALPEATPPLAIFDSDERTEVTAEMWEDVNGYVTGSKPISEFHDKTGSDVATEIILSIVTDDRRTHFINRPNGDCTTGGRPVGNLPGDAFLEMECVVDADGPKPLPVGDFPFGLRGLQMQILDVHEVTVEAIVHRDKALLTRALAMDPLVNSIATANAVVDDVFEAEAEVLGEWRDSRKRIRVGGGKAAAPNAPQLY
jgi:alpha-galactosidase/6-phospho-beta-glucosidase family protein